MAGPSCTVCSHPDREAVDQAIVLGRSNRAVARQYGLSKDSVARHRASHVSSALRAVASEREQAGARSALDRLEELFDAASRILNAAQAEGKAALSLQAVRELRGLTEVIARVTGELDDRAQVNVVNVSTSPEWLATRAAMLEVLQGYPDAAQAVAARLVAIEGPR